MRHARARVQHVSSWVGGIVEGAEPDLVQGQIMGRLLRGENFAHGETNQLLVRGGSRRALTLAEQAVSDLVAIYPWSPTGALLVAHSATHEEHYAYGLTERGALALPGGGPTETASRASIDWDTADPLAPQGVELFETLFLADTTDAGREALVAIKLTGGSLDVAHVEADLDGDTTDGVMRPNALAVFQSVLFASGWEDETVGEAPHVLRHSLLGQDPAASAGWDSEAFALVGAIGQPIRAMRAGRSSLLVAKQQSLFRVYGEPEANPGWQFGIQELDNSVGFGAVNPRSLEHADNRWWGIGLDGPWMSDEARPERLIAARRTSWAQVGDLSASFVAHHPRRNAMLFGFAEPTALVSGQRASRLWVYDLTRGVWAPDFRFPVRFWMARVVPTTGVAAATKPTDLTWVTANGSVDHDSITLEWVIADPNAQTEVWLRPAGGDAAQVATAAPSVGGVFLTGLPASTRYEARVRHRLGEVLTDFSPWVTCATRVSALRPKGATIQQLSAVPFQVDLSVAMVLPGALQTAAFVPVSGGRNIDPAPQAFVGLAAGEVTLLWDTPNADTTGNWAYDFANADPLHPGPTMAAPTLRQTWGIASGFPDNGMFALVQRLDPDAFRCDAISLLLQTTRVGDYTVQIQELVGGAPWVTVGTYNTNTSGLTREITITGLAHSRRYNVRVTAPINSVPVPFVSVVMFTKLEAPIGSIATTGSPEVTLTLAPPDGRTGLDLDVRNVTGSFDALYSAVGGSPAAYVSTVGVCGRADLYLARMRSSLWPVGWQHSAPLVLPVVNVCLP